MELVIKSFNVSREFDELKIILMMNLEINSFAQRQMNTWQTQEPLTMITAAVSFPTLAVTKQLPMNKDISSIPHIYTDTTGVPVAGDMTKIGC